MKAGLIHSVLQSRTVQDMITETVAVWLLTYRLEVSAVGESLSKHLLKGGGLLNGKQQELYLKVICTLSHQVGQTAPVLWERKKIKVFCKAVKKHRWIQHWYGTSMPCTIGHSRNRAKTIVCTVCYRRTVHRLSQGCPSREERY